MKQQSKILHSASSIKTDRYPHFGIGVRPKGRPTSARELFEYQNQKKNEEAWKYDQMIAGFDEMKKLQWQAKVYTSLAEKKR